MNRKKFVIVEDYSINSYYFCNYNYYVQTQVKLAQIYSFYITMKPKQIYKLNTNEISKPVKFTLKSSI